MLCKLYHNEFINLKETTMSMLRKDAYALIRFHKTPNTEYGHIEIRINDMLKGCGNGSLLIRCQTGGTMEAASYAWRYGMEPFSSLLQTKELEEGYRINRAIDRGMWKLRESQGPASCFAEWALQVLRITGVRDIFVVEQLGGCISCEVRDLPLRTLKKDYDYLLHTLQMMEDKLLDKMPAAA